MRQKRSNSYFTFFYPGFLAGGPKPPSDSPYIAIPNDGSFASITGERYGGEQMTAVFYTAQALRDLAHVLEEAADLFEENQVKAGRKRSVKTQPALRDNWVHHVDFERDGYVSIHRHDGTSRSYKLSEAGRQRLMSTIDRLCWSWRPPTIRDHDYERVKNRAVAPMRRFQ